jgi:hypothetical protein
MSSLTLSRNLMTVYFVIFSLLAIAVSSGFGNTSPTSQPEQEGMMAAEAKTSLDARGERSPSFLNREENSEFTQVDHLVTGRAGPGTRISRLTSETNVAPAVEFANQDVALLPPVTLPVTVNADSGAPISEFLQPESNHDHRTEDSEVVALGLVLNPAAIDDSGTVAPEQLAANSAVESNVPEGEGRYLEPAIPTTAANIAMADNSDNPADFSSTPDAITGDDNHQVSASRLPEESFVTSPFESMNAANINSGEVPSEVEFQFSEPAESNSEQDRVELSLAGSLDNVSRSPAPTDAGASYEVVPSQSEVPVEKLAPRTTMAADESTRIDEELIIEPAAQASRRETSSPSRHKPQSNSVADAPLIIPKSSDAEFPGRAVAIIEPAANRRVSKPVPNRAPDEVPSWEEIDSASAKDPVPFVVPPIPSSDELVAAAAVSTDAFSGVQVPSSASGEAIAPLLPIPAAHMNSMPADVSPPQRYLGSARRGTVPPGILSGMKQRLPRLSPPAAVPDVDKPTWLDRMADRVVAFRAGGKSVASSSEKSQSGTSTKPSRGLIPQRKVPGQNLRQSQHALGKQGMTQPSPTKPTNRPNAFPPEFQRLFPEIAVADAERRTFRLPDLKMPSLYLPAWSVPQRPDLSPGTWEIQPYIVELDIPMPEFPQLPEWLVELPDADPLEPLRNSAAVHRVSSTIRYAAEPKVVR